MSLRSFVLILAVATLAGLICAGVVANRAEDEEQADDDLGPVNCVAVSSDGRRILSGHADSKARYWDLETGEQLACFGDERPWVTCVAFSPDGRRAAFAHASEVVHLWDLETGREVRRFQGHTGTVTSVTFAPGGAILSASRDRTVRVWDAVSGAELQCLKGHLADVNSIAASHDGRFVLSGGGDYWGGKKNDPSIRMWDLRTGQALPGFEGEVGVTQCVAFSPNDRFAFSCGWDTAVQLWDLQSRKELKRFGSGHVNCAAFTPDGKRILSGVENGMVQLWEIASGKEVLRLQGHTAGIHGLAISPDGGTAVTCSGDRGSAPRKVRRFFGLLVFNELHRVPVDCTLRLWDLATGKEIRRFSIKKG